MSFSLDFLGSVADNVVVEWPSVLAWVYLAVSVLLLLCSGLASASEIAFFSLSPKDMEEVEECRRGSDARILSLKAQSDRLLATILILNNLVNVAIIMLLNFFFMDWLHFGEGTEWLEFAILTVLLTFLLLLFGEIIPKIYSSN